MSFDWDNTALPEPTTAAEIYNRALAAKVRMNTLPKPSRVSHVHSLKYLAAPKLAEKEAEIEFKVVTSRPDKRSTIDLIIDVVCHVLKVDRMEIVSVRRKKHMILPRHIIMFLAAKDERMTRYFIGKHMGRDASSVTGAVKKIKSTQVELADQIAACEAKLAEILGRGQ